MGQITTKLRAALLQILRVCAVWGWFVKRQRGGLLVAQRQIEAISKGQQSLVVQFLLAVRGHLALTSLAHAIAFFGVRQDDRGLAAVLGCCGIGGVNLHQVVTAALQSVDLLVGQALCELRQFGVLTKKAVAVEAAVLGGKGLHLAVHRVGKGPHQGLVGVAGKQAVPVAAPDELDDVPTRTSEQLFQLVNDAAIAPDRPIQALQIAVDHPHQVVELFPRGQGEGAHALGFVHFAISKHAPDLATRAVLQLAVGQVAHEACVVDGADGPQAHGARGELPKIGHQPWVGVAGEALGTSTRRTQLLTVMVQVLFAQTAFQKRAGIHPRGAVRLEKHQVRPLCAVVALEEMVEAHLEQVRSAGIACDMTAQFTISRIGLCHHGQGVPAHQRGQFFFDRQVAGVGLLRLDRDGVHIRGDQFG